MKNSISWKLEKELIEINSLSDSLNSWLSEVQSAKETLSNQKEAQTFIESRITHCKANIQQANDDIQATQQETAEVEARIEEVNQEINNANVAVKELALESFMKDNKIQQLMKQLAEARREKTPFKRNQSKSALKGGRSYNYKTISTKTPSTAESFTNKKVLIK